MPENPSCFGEVWTNTRCLRCGSFFRHTPLPHPFPIPGQIFQNACRTFPIALLRALWRRPEPEHEVFLQK